ncbi:MAG: menaquinone biosynthetic enzyme MqnA/MqnD family protein [Armatimonadota bacterium]
MFEQEISAYKSLRIGLLEYANTKPILFGMESMPHSIRPRITLGTPSAVVEMLCRGDLDAGVVSSIECFRRDGLAVVPGIGITAKGEVMSVKLFAAKELSLVRSIAVDRGSRSAAVLTRILFAELYGAQPRFVSCRPDLDTMLLTCDAALLIGDSALTSPAPPGVDVFDLGREWYQLTGLPFVYALCAVRNPLLVEDVYKLLIASVERGQKYLSEIVRSEAERLGLEPELLDRYFREVLRYVLTPEDEAGLRKFVELAAVHGLAAPDADRSICVAQRRF